MKGCYESLDFLNSPFLFSGCAIIFSMIPDYDDFYSLTAYARRFIKTPMREIEGWLSQRSTVAMITDWERRNGNESFRESSVPYLFERADRDEVITVPDFIALTSCQGIAMDGDEVIADISIYNDFVAFLTARGINI